MPLDFNGHIITEFRANAGRVGGPFADGRLLLLTTTGARSGERHTTPVGYLPDGDRVLIIASAAGSPRHPAWFHNLVANPIVHVEVGAFEYDATAVVLAGAERDEMFARASEADDGWAVYQRQTSRVIPVVALEPVFDGPPKADTPGQTLVLIHDTFRHELRLVRAEVLRTGPRIGAQLRVNCLTMCQGLQHHHQMEDSAVFPHFAGANPAFRPVFDRLAVEHDKIAVLLAQLQRAVSDVQSDPAVVLAEVDRLIADLEGHLSYEEEQLIPLLNATALGRSSTD